MTYHVLPESGIPVAAGMVQRVTVVEQQTEAVQERMRQHSQSIAGKFKEGRVCVDGDKPDLEDWAELLDDDEDFAAEFNGLFDNLSVAEADDEFDPDSFDTYLNMELALDRGDEHPQHAKVCLLYTSPSPRDLSTSRMPSSA